MARRTKIIATIGPASDDPSILRQMIDAGVDVFRIGLAHGSLSDAVERYLIELVLATRDARPYDPSLARRIAFGASPRGTIALERCARAHAWLAGRDYVAPQDIHAVAHDVLRHRVLLSFEAEAEGAHADAVIDRVLDCVPVP